MVLDLRNSFYMLWEYIEVRGQYFSVIYLDLRINFTVAVLPPLFVGYSGCFVCLIGAGRNEIMSINCGKLFKIYHPTGCLRI